MAFIQIDKKHFFNNLDIIASKTKTKDKIALVLKDNAYGHGLELMATLAKEYGITKAVVQTAQEAETIAKYFEYVLALAPLPKEPHPKVCYTINDYETIQNFPKGCRVELKVDSGMHRNGVSAQDLAKSFEAIKKRGLLLEGVFTHHRSADILSSEWFWQKQNFAKIKSEARELAQRFGFAPLRFHSANSAALLRENNFDEDMARVGVAAYGCLELPEPLAVDGFKPVLSLYAKRNSKRILKAGQRVGYGGRFTSAQECVVSNYDLGYGDGLFRLLSNNYTTPEGKKLVGTISMDNSSFLSDTEELLIFNDAREIAKVVTTIGYEVLTALKPEIQRVVV